EEVVGVRARQAQLYWMLGDEPASASAMAQAQRCADGIAWPDTLAELAFAQAHLARWRGEPDRARALLATIRPRFGSEPNGIHVMVLDLHGYLAEDLDEAREHRAEAFQLAVRLGHRPLIALVLIGVADLALCKG